MKKIMIQYLKEERFSYKDNYKIFGKLLKNYSKNVKDPLGKFLFYCYKNENIDKDL